jgi:hypothetical protein
VSGVTAIGQPPLINMMAAKARPLSSLIACDSCISVSSFACWLLVKLVNNNKVIR